MSRLVPYRTKVSEEVAASIQQTLSTTMYLVQTTGPTSYVIQEQNCNKKHKVLIGSLQSCSCGTADICIHILFVMLKVLRVPATTPVVWQKSLIDSEIETLLRGGYREQSRPAPKPFMKRRKEEAAAKTEQPEDIDVERHELVEGEVCAICQEDMDDNQPLTFCRKGCGNNFHIECMKVFGESRRQSKENIICPLCRQDWGDTALSSLRKEIDAANRAPNVHKGASCRKCKIKPIRCERYRCVQCKNVDLCARCFKSNAHSSHAFVMKNNVPDPWVPASRGNQPRTAISSDIIRDLENRELSTNDYDILLQLDQGDKRPIQDYLVKVVSGTKANAENAKTFGESGSTCSLCAQSLRIKASLHSTLCGHVFHESCLARSILAQMYACPYPGCDQPLLPGLLYLQQKYKTRKTEQSSEQKQEISDAMPVLDASFAVLGLQQRYSQGHVTGDTSSKGPSSRRNKRVAHLRTHRDGIELPSLPGLVSVGIVPHKQPTMDERALVPNQLEHENVAPGYSDRASSTRSFARGKLAKATRAQSALPALGQPVPSFLSDEQVTENRLNHAEKIRSELKAIERERLQKQRLQREERRQRHQESSVTSAFTGVLIGEERAQTVKVPLTRVHQVKLKFIERHHQARERSHLPTTLPDLFVGNGR